MLEDVQFQLDRATLLPQALRVLDAAAAALLSDPALRLRIEGHTCEFGTNEYNVALGQRRAHAVRDYLVSRGVGAERLETLSLGEERPKHDLRTEATRARNRRAELHPVTTTEALSEIEGRFLLGLSPQLGQLAAIAAQCGHDVVVTRDRQVDGDIAVVLSSLVDYRHETAWADAMRARGVRTGFVGLAASKVPQLFADHGDFVIAGEPEDAFGRLARGERLEGICASPEVGDLDPLPFPRWDLLTPAARLPGRRLPLATRPLRGGFPLGSSRSCPESFAYRPLRTVSSYRSRSVASLTRELRQLCERHPRPHVVFRDPVFTQERDRCLALSEDIRSRGLRLTFECETRLDLLDETLIDQLHAAGLRTISFGVESFASDTLRRMARRPIPPRQSSAIVEHCRRRGISTIAQYVLGFPEDDWASVAATIEYAVELGSIFAQFRLLTPYPGTPLWQQLEPLIFEGDWRGSTAIRRRSATRISPATSCASCSARRTPASTYGRRLSPTTWACEASARPT